MRGKKLFKSVIYIVLFLFIVFNAISAWQAFIFTHFSEKKISKQSNTNFIQQKFEKIFGKEHPRQLVVDSLAVTHQSLYIRSDSFKLAAWYLHHNTDSAKGTIIMFHGYGSSRSELIPQATVLYNMQYNVFMIDFRAHGNSSGNVCTMGYLESADVKTAYNFIKNTGEKNIIMYAGSMGAAAVTKAINDDAAVKPAKIILEKCFGTMSEAVKALVRNSMHEPEQPAATILTCWGSAEQGIYMFSMKPELYVKKITCPVLLQVGDHDENVSRHETESIYNNIGSQKKKLIIYPNCGHQNLFLKDPLLWKNSISNFLSS